MQDIHYRIYIAIFWERMQITENQILSKCRERNVFWCRIILCNFFKKQKKKNVEIAIFLKTTKGAVSYFVTKFREDFRYCEMFRKLTIEIENIKKQVKIAQILNITPETFSRQLEKLKKENIIENEKGYIKILDYKKIQNFISN